jgi:hypothetical protein
MPRFGCGAAALCSPWPLVTACATSDLGLQTLFLATALDAHAAASAQSVSRRTSRRAREKAVPEKDRSRGVNCDK